MSEQTQAKYTELVKRKCAEADSIYGTSLESMVKVTYNARGGNCAKAHINRQGLVPVVTFIVNPEALEQDWTDMVEDTIPHEVAHLVNFLKPHTGKNHDRGWKRTCQILGGTGNRTAVNGNYKLTPARVATKHRYRMPDGSEHILGPKRHAKLQKGTAAYRVSSTNEPILAANYIGPLNPPKLNTNKHSKVPPVAIRGGKVTKTSIVRGLVEGWMAEGYTSEQILTNPANVEQVKLKAGYPHLGIAKSSLKHNVEKLLAEK